MANATLRDLSEDSSFAESDVIPKQSVGGPLNKITGLKFLNSLASGGELELSLAADQAAAAGVDTTVQYSNNSVRGGDADLVWDNSGKALTVGAVTATAQLKLPQSYDQISPTLAFGDGDSGMFTAGSALHFGVGENFLLWFASDKAQINNSASNPSLRNVSASSTVPTLAPIGSDTNTGVGTGTADTLSLIAGGVEIARGVEAATDFLAIYAEPRNDRHQIMTGVPSSFMFMVIDENNDELEFWVKYADGVAKKSHSLALA